MFNLKSLANQYHSLQKEEQELIKKQFEAASSSDSKSPYPPPPNSKDRDQPTFNPLQLLAYLSQLDLSHPPAALLQAFKNPIVLIGLAIFLYLLISLLSKLLFFAVIGGVLWVVLKGTGGNGGNGPEEDVKGRTPRLQSTQSPFPSPGVGNANTPPSQSEEPKDLASFLWQKGLPAGMEIAQTFLSKKKRDVATREVRDDE
ncbi:hypothetical protein JCM5353_003751 [Sporobolomyces roseus]